MNRLSRGSFYQYMEKLRFDGRRITQNRIRTLAVLLTVVLGFAPERILAERPTTTHITTNPTSGEVEQVLEFDVQADPDRQYISGSGGLAPTVFNAALKANSNATVDEARVMPLSLMEERIGFAAQGSSTINAPTFANWQYIDRLVTWGGTSSRNVTAPGQAWIDAAHRNGVKVYGNIFLAPRAFGGRVSHVEYLTQTDGSGNYIVADRLIELAETQGFDGWFLNEEVSLTSTTQAGEPAADPVALAEEVGKFMDYVQANSSVEIVWYDAMTESGSVGWQEELNSSNDRFFQNNGKVVSDAMFLDFTPTVSELANSKTTANNLGRSEFDVYAGALMETSGIGEGDFALDRFASQGDTSISMFRSDKESWFAYRDSGWTLENYIRAEEQLYVGQAGDPSNTSQDVVAWDETTDSFTEATSWNGMAHYIAAKSPLVRDRFVSNFNYGLGTDYFMNGSNVSTQNWNNMGAQDVLPTWRWMVETTDATPISVNFDFDDAYIGGSSIKVEGSLDEDTDLPLYLASMDVFSDSKLTLTFKTGEVGASSMEAYISLEGDELNRISFPVGSTTTTGWEEIEIDLSAYAGQTIASIGLRFLDNDDATYDVSIGQLGIIRGARDVVSPATNIDIDSMELSTSSIADLRLNWEHSTDNSADYLIDEVYYYNVYQELADSSRIFLGVTGGEGLYIEQLSRQGLEFNSTIIVEAIGIEFGASPETFLISWGDVDGDGIMSQADVDDFILGWKTDTSSFTYEDKVAAGDVNADGITDFNDWFIVRQAMIDAGVTFTFALNAVPEPTTLVMVLGMCLPVLGMRRR